MNNLNFLKAGYQESEHPLNENLYDLRKNFNFQTN